MQSYGVPRCLDSSLRYVVTFEELTDRIRAINFEAIGRAAELLQQAKIMECGTDK